jgi:hypothetical protein
MAYFKMYSKKTINGGDFVMDKKFIGTFELTDKNVIISDPCYDVGTWCQGELNNVKTGVWNAYIKESEDGSIAELIVCYIGVNDISKLDNKWNLESFTIGVDSGQAGFFQKDKYRNNSTSLDMPSYFPEKDDRWYGVCCNITLSRQGAGVLEGGVVSSSGYGDGCYDMYTIEEEGEVVAMKIVFIDEYDGEEFEETDEEYDEEEEC